MSVSRQRSSSRHDNADFAAHQLGHLLEHQPVVERNKLFLKFQAEGYNFLHVNQRRRVAALHPLDFVLVEEFEEQLAEGGARVNLVVDALGNAIEYQRHRGHACGLQNSGIALASAPNLTAGIDQGQWCRVSNWHAGHQAHTLRHQFKNVGQGQESDQDVIRIDGHHVDETLHRGNAVLVGQQDSLGRSCRAGRVHDDGDVISPWWHVLCKNIDSIRLVRH